MQQLRQVRVRTGDRESLFCEVDRFAEVLTIDLEFDFANALLDHFTRALFLVLRFRLLAQIHQFSVVRERLQCRVGGTNGVPEPTLMHMRLYSVNSRPEPFFAVNLRLLVTCKIDEPRQISVGGKLSFQGLCPSEEFRILLLADEFLEGL